MSSRLRRSMTLKRFDALYRAGRKQNASTFIDKLSTTQTSKAVGTPTGPGLSETGIRGPRSNGPRQANFSGGINMAQLGEALMSTSTRASVVGAAENLHLHQMELNRRMWEERLRREAAMVNPLEAFQAELDAETEEAPRITLAQMDERLNRMMNPSAALDSERARLERLQRQIEEYERHQAQWREEEMLRATRTPGATINRIPEGLLNYQLRPGEMRQPEQTVIPPLRPLRGQYLTVDEIRRLYPDRTR